MTTATPPTPTDRRRRSIGLVDVAVLSAVTVLPLLLGGRGRLNADTKQHLYLAPVDLMERARVLWDSRVGGGAVTHQAIGYLWPMGPFYALTDTVGMPDWAAQRLWVGLLQLVAGLGALALFRHLLPRSWTQLAAATVYALSPFVLGLVTSQSALLLPYAALGWLVLAMAWAVEAPRSWRGPAAFALIVTTCGSLNGSSIFFVVLAAALWVPAQLAGRGKDGRRDGLRVLLRTAGLTGITQLWWLVAYAVGGRYGLPVLDITETVRTTNATSSATEVLRGLGYWTFYGTDTEGPWLSGLAAPYQTSGLLLVISFGVPIACLGLGSWLRWRPAAYFGLLVGLGTILAVGAFPSSDPSPAGRLFERASRSSDLVLSLRNTQRAAALVAFGLAGLAAGGLSLLERHNRRAALAAGTLVLLLVAGALPAQWRTGLIAERFHRQEELPTAWLDAAAALHDGDSRVLELPGSDFAAYRWGYTLDPVSVGLTDRSVMARELVPMGGDAGADLLEALDRSLQEGWFEPAALAPVARLLGASDVLVRNDLEFERHRTPRPSITWPLFAAAAPEPPRAFGAPYANVAGPVRTMIDEIELGRGLAPDAIEVPQVAVLEVPDGARPALSAHSIGGGVVVDGDGEGIVAAAAGGLLDDLDGVLLLGADVADGDLGPYLGDRTRIVLTDTNRKRAHRWYTVRENVGATEPADHGVVLSDPTDARLSIAGREVAGTRSVVEWRGVERIWATTYGQPASLLPEERPSNAFDGDATTAWRSERTDDGSPRTLGVDIGRLVSADHLVLVPPQGRIDTAAVTHARVTLDGERTVDVTLSREEALDPAGARIDLDGRPFRTVEIEVLDTDPFLGRAGFAEVQIPGVEVEEVVVLPSALVDRLGAEVADRPVAIVLTRLRADPAEPKREDPEPAMARRIDLPVPLAVRLAGVARLDPRAPGPVVDALLGAGPSSWAARVTSSAQLPGALAARPSSALDGDLGTAWQTPLGNVVGQWIEIDLDAPVSMSTLEAEIVVDERHSTPTQFELAVDGSPPLVVAVPPLEGGPLGTTRRISLPLPETLVGTTWRLTVSAVDVRATTDWYTGFDFALPVAMAEITVPGLAARPAEVLDTTCRDDLLTLDGRSVPIRVEGEPAGDASRAALSVVPCEDGLEIPAGPVDLRTTAGRATGLSLDRLDLRTAEWERVVDTAGAPTAEPRHPTVEVSTARPGAVRGTVTTDGEAFWLLLDESMNEGWDLQVDGARVEGPRPLDAHAAGWYVIPDGPGRLSVEARWAPQRTADIALAVSAIGVLACVVLALRGRRRPMLLLPIGPPEPERSPSPTTLPIAALVTLAGAALVSLGAGLAGGVVVLIARRWPWVGRLAPVGLVALAGGLVVAEQVTRRHPAAFAWPAQFTLAHEVALIAMVLLCAISLVRLLPRHQ